MSFIKVDRPEWEPYRCCMTLRDVDPDGFYVGETIRGLDPHAFVAVSAVRTLARAEGFVSGDDFAEVCQELNRARARVAELEAEVAELSQSFEAIDLLASKGFQARKKPGRPKTERQAV